MSELVTFSINGREVQAPAGANLIEACEDAGVYIPRFCHHKRMNPVGMCRMCIVEVDTGRGPSLQPTCMLTVAEGMAVDTESDVTKKAQDGILEFLLVNHPLDCPVCDKGGECPLQDQTMAYGPGESRFIEEKRHFEKPIPVNDNVYLDRERCILCDRCTRFADEVAGDPLIHFIDRGNQTQVNTFPDEPFSSYFSGNTVQICPVGALTAKPYRFKARPWDLEEIESTYPNPMGDRIAVQSSRDQVVRFQGVDSDAVNWGWLTDRDRFAFEALQGDGRLVQPLVRGGGLNQPDPEGDELVPASWAQALQLAADALGGCDDATRIAVVGGARLSNEGQYAWTKLAKSTLGTDNVDATLGDELPADVLLGLPRSTIADVCRPGGTIVLLGVDPKETHGTLYLRLRHAAMQDGARIIELTPTATGLSNVAAARLHPRPGEAHLVAQALVSGVINGDIAGVRADDLRAAHQLVQDGPVHVVVGRGSLAESVAPTLAAITALRELEQCHFLPVANRGNVMGALDMGMAPGLLPGRTPTESGRAAFAAAWNDIAAQPGMATPEILQAAADGRIDVLVLLGADPLSDAPDAVVAEQALSNAGTVIAVDLFANGSMGCADIVFPAAAFTESSGSHTNIEGRITPIRQKVTPPGTARPDWMIAAELAMALGGDLGLEDHADVWNELAPLSAVHGDVSTAAIEAAADGVLITATGRVAFDGYRDEIALAPVDSYALRLVATRRMYDNGTHLQQARSLAGLAGTATLRLNPYDFNRLGVADGQNVVVTSSSASISMPVVADPAVPRGVASGDYNREGTDLRRLFDREAVAVDVRIDATGGTP